MPGSGGSEPQERAPMGNDHTHWVRPDGSGPFYQNLTVT